MAETSTSELETRKLRIEAVVRVQQWVESNYTDPTYGRIADAECITETEQLGELLTTGWSWSNPEQPTW